MPFTHRLRPNVTKIILKSSFIFLFITSTLSCQENKPRVIQETFVTTNSFNEFVSTVKLPESLEFCGEVVPLDDDEVRERAEREFYLLLQQPGQIALYLKRSGRYFPLFEKHLRASNMPEDLKYLSVAESALFMSRSSKGAMGLWQIMEGTAKELGLTVNQQVDERRHPEKSTIAGLKYLRQGFAKHKSWILTAAGYNMGNYGLAKNIDSQNKDNYFDLWLNEETSRYIFRIVIIKEMMQNPEKYGFMFKDSDLYKPYNSKTVKITSEISDIVKWSEEQGTNFKMVRLLNPWILGKSLPKPSKGDYYEIEIPN